MSSQKNLDNFPDNSGKIIRWLKNNVTFSRFEELLRLNLKKNIQMVFLETDIVFQNKKTKFLVFGIVLNRHNICNDYNLRSIAIKHIKNAKNMFFINVGTSRWINIITGTFAPCDKTEGTDDELHHISRFLNDLILIENCKFGHFLLFLPVCNASN